MEIKKVISYLGYAIKSRNIIFGYDKLMTSKIKPFLVIISSTLNEKMSERVIRFTNENNITTIKLTDKRLEDLVNRDNCKVVGIIDVNLATALKNEFKMDN